MRPLAFDWPHDSQVRNDVDAWLFGDSLLVSPVVVQGQTSKDIYLPAGTWTDWFSGKVYRGGQRVRLAIDSAHWHDIPLFVRQGAIIPTQPVMGITSASIPSASSTSTCFPTTGAARSTITTTTAAPTPMNTARRSASRWPCSDKAARCTSIDAAIGSYTPALAFYLLKIHGGSASAATRGGTALPSFDSLDSLVKAGGEGWSRGQDVYGSVTYVRVKAALAQHIVLSLDRTSDHPNP